MPDIPCPDCEGRGTVRAIVCTVLESDALPTLHDPLTLLRCFLCHGKRTITLEHAEWVFQGEQIRKDRVREGCSGRERARMLNITPLTLNQIEHGKIDPKEILIHA